MGRQGTNLLLIKDPWGWSRTQVGDRFEPKDPIDLDARRRCSINRSTNAVADVAEFNRLLDLLKLNGITPGVYIGSPRAPQWATLTDRAMDSLASAVASPFRGRVGFWVVDELSESDGSDRAAVFGASLAKYSEAPILGEPRALRGKVASVGGSVVTASKWKSSMTFAGDLGHLGTHELPDNYPTYIISGGDSVETVREWVAGGARFFLGLWEPTTRVQIEGV